MEAARRSQTILLVALGVAWALGLPSAHVAADPVLIDNLDGTTDAVWNFTNPADYVLANASITAQGVSLKAQMGWWNSTAAADFAGPENATNVNWTVWPGDVVLSSTSGPATTVTIQPDATVGKDSYIEKGNPTTNYGNDPTLVLDTRAASARRPLLQFNLSVLPMGAVIDRAFLSLYQSASAVNPTTAEVRALTTPWDEATVTWDLPWVNKGGDYDPRIIASASLNTTTGWKIWNVTPVVDLWHRGRIPNYGLILTGPGGGGVQDKTFWSSDYSTDPTLRPKLEVRYRLLGASGEYVSHIGGPGTPVAWQSISWNVTDRSLATDEFDGTALDAKWSWLNPPASYDVGGTTPGSLHVVSQPMVDLDGPTFTGHVLVNEIVGNFTAIMKINSNPTVDGQKAGLLVLVDSRNWYAIQKTRTGGIVEWQAKATVDAVSTIRANSSSGNPIPAWMRLVRRGNSFATSTSADGVTWTAQDTYVPAFEYPLQVRLGLFVADGNSGTPHTIDVDYLRISFGNDGTVQVRTRIGDTSPVDGTWSNWSFPYPTPAGSAMSGRSRYVEFRLSFAVTYPDHTPAVGDVNVSWATFLPSGSVETNDLVPADLSGWGNFSVVELPNGQSIAYACSPDSGVSWHSVLPPGPLPAACQAGTKLRFRAILSTADQAVTPVLREMRITYVHRLDHFYVTTSPTATAGTAFTVTVVAKDAGNATLTAWAGPVTLEARLSDGVTPGGGSLGTTTLVVSSGGTATLTTETYTRAEAIRILAYAGSASGLSDLILVGPGPLASAVVTPDNVTLLPLDTQEFIVQSADAWGNPIPDLSFDWTTAGGIGTLNTSVGSAVTFTATALGNGTVTATSGSVNAVAQVHVVPGVRPWIAITSPAAGAYLTGVATLRYANSSDSVTVRFEYDDGTGWTLIGTTAVLDGIFSWDTRGLNFTDGSLRAVVTNNRTVTNSTLVSPISVDNAPPALSLGAVADDQAATGTLTLTYSTSPDTTRVDFSYFDGAWHPIGSDVTIDGSYLWTPGGPVNGVTVRGVAVDRVGLLGVDEKMGVGRFVSGSSGPVIRSLPVLHLQVGAPYVLNLTFYLSDPDTPLASLALWTSDATNASVSLGPYPALVALYRSLGTYYVTLWASDGTDTDWQILTIVASGNRPPVLVQALPSVAFEENTVAVNGLQAPATAFFTDPDGDPLIFEILDGTMVSGTVHPNATLDFSAASNWYGIESLRLRAADPTGAFAEASLLVVVWHADRPPILAPIPSFTLTTGEPYVFDLTPYLSDEDTPLAQLLVAVDTPYVSVNGHQLILNFPSNWTGNQFTITVSDGNRTASQTVGVTLLIPPASGPSEAWWQAPYVLAIPPAALLVVVAMFVQRQRFRPAKAFLVDERGRLIREFTLDPACTVSFDEAVNAGALDAREKDVRVSKYHARSVHGDALAVVLLAYGPVNLQEVEFAREMLVNIQDKFEDRVKEGLAEVRAEREALCRIGSEIEEARRDLHGRARVFGEIVEALNATQSKIAREALDLRSRGEALRQAETRLREERESLEGLSQELERVRASLAPRLREVEQREADVGRREEEADMREAALASREASLVERESQIAAKEEALIRRTEGIVAREAALEEGLTALRSREEELHASEDRVKAERQALEAQGLDLEARRQALEARAAEVEAQAKDVAKRLEDLEALRTNLGPRETRVLEREAELDEQSKALREERATLQRQSDLVAAKALEVQQREAALEDQEADLAREKQLLHDAKAALESERMAFQERIKAAEVEWQKQREELEAQTRALGEERLRLARDREDFERLRDEKEQWIASKEIELESREQSLLEKEATIRDQGEENTRRLAELVAREEALEVESAKLDRTRGELESRRGELAALQAELDQRIAKLREEEARKAEELRTWQATLESEQALLREQRESFEGEMRDLRESWAGRLLRLEQREAELATREAKVQSDVEWVARSESELARRERAAEEALNAATAMKAEAETLRKEVEQRALEIESRERTLREEAAAQTVELTKRSESLAALEAELARKRAEAEAEAEARGKRLQDLEAELQKRAQALDARAAELESMEARIRSLQELSHQEEERLLREKTDVQKLAEQLEARQLELDQMKERLEAEAARIRDETETSRQALAAKEADLRSERERLERESSSLQEKLGAKAQELALREKALEAREEEARAEEQDLEARLRDLESRERQALAQTTEIKAQLDALARREKELSERGAQLEETVRKFDLEAAAKRKEWETFQEALKSKEAMLEAAAESRQLEIAKRIEDLTQREQAIDAARAQMEIERNKIENLGRSVAAKEADLAASAERLEKRAQELKEMENELLSARKAFEAERASWSARRSEELKQLEATRDSAAEQVHQAERLIQESQRRAYLAEEAEKAAKRQIGELSALQTQVEARRAEAERAERDLQVHMAQLQEASQQLAAREVDLTARVKELENRQAKVAERERAIEAASREIASRKEDLDREAARLASLEAELDRQRAEAEARRQAIETKLNEIAKRDEALSTELQRADNLMEDLSRKEAELAARKKDLAAFEERLRQKEEELKRHEGELLEGMKTLERTSQDIEKAKTTAEADRKAAASLRQEADAMRAEAEKLRTQAEAMQAEVSKNMRFLQKKALDVLDREEKNRALEFKIEEETRALNARSEGLAKKEKILQTERDELVAKVEQLRTENERLKASLAEIRAAPPPSQEVEAWRKDIENRVKIIQRKALELLDREEKLRKKEEELRALAEQIGVQP